MSGVLVSVRERKGEGSESRGRRSETFATATEVIRAAAFPGFPHTFFSTVFFVVFFFYTYKYSMSMTRELCPIAFLA